MHLIKLFTFLVTKLVPSSSTAHLHENTTDWQPSLAIFRLSCSYCYTQV